MRRRAIPVFGAIVVFALAIPTLASATWTHKGKGELKENASITLSGELSVSTGIGKVTCPTSIGATLTGSSSSGTVNSYTVSEPSKCDLSELLGSVCGTHGVTKVEKTGSWELTAEETKIKISSIDLEFKFGKCLIPSLRLKGTATATPDKTFAMNTLFLSGSQTLYNALEEEAGSASLGGAPSVSPAATYGVKTAPLVKTAWLMENEHLSENGEMTLSGALAFSYSGGSVSCTASTVLTLTGGEVEEEESEGEVKSFTVSEPSKCVAGGALKTLCGEHPVKSVTKTGTWTLNATEEDISVSGLSLDYNFEKCAITSLALKGGAILSVEKPISIESIMFTGKPTVYNASEENVGTAELSGKPSASPKGTYAIEKALPAGFERGTIFDVLFEEAPNEVTLFSEGWISFEDEFGTFECHVEFGFESTGLHKGVTYIEPDAEPCAGFGCEASTVTPTYLPGQEGFATHVAKKPGGLVALLLTDVRVDYNFVPECGFEARVEFGTVVLSSEEQPLHQVAIEGQGTDTIFLPEEEFGSVESLTVGEQTTIFESDKTFEIK